MYVVLGRATSASALTLDDTQGKSHERQIRITKPPIQSTWSDVN